MTRIQVKRLANVSVAEAKASLEARYPGYQVEPGSFHIRENVDTGDKVYVAHVVKADFPPLADEGPNANKADSGTDDFTDSEPKEDKPDKPKEGGGKDSQILTLLKQVADALGVKGGGDEPTPDLPPGPGAADALPPPVKPHPLAGGGGGLGMPSALGKVLTSNKLEIFTTDAVSVKEATASAREEFGPFGFKVDAIHLAERNGERGLKVSLVKA